MLYWRLGRYLVERQPQNRQGDRVYLVTDTGKSLLEARGSKTNTGMIFHTDSSSAFAGSRPDILALLCLRKAVSGGESLMVSGHTAYNALLERSPNWSKNSTGRSASTAPLGAVVRDRGYP